MVTEMATETKTVKTERATIAATIPATLSEFVEDYRWNPEVRLSRSEVVAQAVQFWAEHNGYVSADKPAKA